MKLLYNSFAEFRGFSVTLNLICLALSMQFILWVQYVSTVTRYLTNKRRTWYFCFIMRLGIYQIQNSKDSACFRSYQLRKSSFISCCYISSVTMISSIYTYRRLLYPHCFVNDKGFYNIAEEIWAKNFLCISYWLYSTLIFYVCSRPMRILTFIVNGLSLELCDLCSNITGITISHYPIGLCYY